MRGKNTQQKGAPDNGAWRIEDEFHCELFGSKLGEFTKKRGGAPLYDHYELGPFKGTVQDGAAVEFWGLWSRAVNSVQLEQQLGEGTGDLVVGEVEVCNPKEVLYLVSFYPAVKDKRLLIWLSTQSKQIHLSLSTWRLFLKHYCVTFSPKIYVLSCWYFKY